MIALCANGCSDMSFRRKRQLNKSQENTTKTKKPKKVQLENKEDDSERLKIIFEKLYTYCFFTP